MIRIKKTTKKNKVKDRTNLRICVVAFFALLLFIIVILHLAYIQFVQGEELSEKAYNQQIKNQIISPSRGTIYDSNGVVLAQSISVDTISINPGKITYSNGKDVDNETIASGLSSIFEDVTYEELLEDLNSEKSVIVVAKKVEQEKVDELETWMAEEGITAGINIDEDSKRYYPNGSLASNLIGFCGTDNEGQVGLEQRWNDVLTGTSGKIVTVTDVNDNPISDEDEQYVEAENGSNIYLTIDSTVQSIAEKYLSQAMAENPTAESGSVIIMNPQTGDILAMAQNPSYDLNNPSSYEATGYTEEEWNELESSEKSNILQELWKNTNVSGTYEPGSTFKLITASVGLEEGIVDTDTPNVFTCTGSMTFEQKDDDPVIISCWRSYNPHGSQSLRDAVCNSCNPAFMQLGSMIGAKTLYKYFQAFGLFDTVGSDIAKAYKGQFTELESIGQVELATTSFGQRFEISPLQLITAVSAICNDGVLVEPKIVKQIENTNTGSTELVETETVRQVISKDTADKVKSMMQSVVTDGTGYRAAVSGYSIGGKSGTSEPLSSNTEDGYIASFIAISPIENTQVVVLVILEGLDYEAKHQGGEVCGPVAGQILSEILPYLGITSDSAEDETDEDTLISLVDVTDMTVDNAKTKLESLGFNVICNTTEDTSTALVVDQVPKSGISLFEGATICLYTTTQTERTMVEVPNVKDMTAAQAEATLEALNLNIVIDGTSGIVTAQEPTYGTQVEEGTVINVTIKEKIDGNQ